MVVSDCAFHGRAASVTISHVNQGKYESHKINIRRQHT